jgi:hypothetical protein
MHENQYREVDDDDDDVLNQNVLQHLQQLLQDGVLSELAASLEYTNTDVQKCCVIMWTKSNKLINIYYIYCYKTLTL